MTKILPSELVLNDDNSVYHLKLHPEQLARDIIVVGDPGRVSTISAYFDTIEHQVSNREIVTHTGTLNGKRLTVMSTGMGTDNIDIVMNELDALVNIDLANRTVKQEHQSLNIIRIGTSGSLQADIPVDSYVVSEYGLGLDGLMNYYAYDQTDLEMELLNEFYRQTGYLKAFAQPYFIKGSSDLFNFFKDSCHSGITATAPGFYGPQGRVLRLALQEPQLNEKLNGFRYQHLKVVNFEMETSALYGLGRALGHETCTVCAIVANRFTNEFSKDYKASVKKLIELVLAKLTERG
ncbi:MAG: nucleoside phosphorylase [Flavobacteriales bacterium]|nr:nucleoside phosphorylase [Flavobacteriales bacterium]